MASSNGKNQYRAMAEAIADAVKPHFTALKDGFKQGLDGVNERLDAMLKNQGDYYRSLDDRVRELEQWRRRHDPDET